MQWEALRNISEGGQSTTKQSLSLRASKCGDRGIFHGKLTSLRKEPRLSPASPESGRRSGAQEVFHRN